MSAIVKKAGILSSFQDLGRYGFQSAGVPVSGAMDTVAARVANYLVGNKDNATVLELTYGNFALLTEMEMLLSFCGAGANVSAGELKLDLWKTYFIPAGTLLTFRPGEKGSRCYIAVAGGWDAAEWLHSTSTCLPAKIGAKLTAGDRISARKHSVLSETILNSLRSAQINFPSWGVVATQVAAYGSAKINLIRHHEFDWFDQASQNAFFNSSFTPAIQSSRMGYQLQGPVLTMKEKRQLLSTAVCKGTLQVTSAGTVILLMADCQTTGGYPRIGQVAAADLPVCAQFKPGDHFTFNEITMQQAEELLIAQEKTLLELKATIKDRFQSFRRRR